MTPIDNAAWTPERWERISPVLDAALECLPHERASCLSAACGGDEQLRVDVERLLAVADEDNLWLDQGAAERFGALLPETTAEDDATGRQIGSFRLLQEVGRGGMGVVYRAERVGRQFEQQVALKLVKRGMDTDFVLARFFAERQILASLAHPNIARLLDGGTTDDGRPYFVMEYIEGEPIDRFAQARNLSIPARLELFLSVCDAVGYAHQQLVVHRDLKPLNIMVTPEGVPKLLDFGIARLLQDDGDGATSTVVRALTPEYASPEQVEGRRAATASDVYSLGVVLYELLTGTLPYVFRSRSPEDVAEAIRTTEPPRPSTRATTFPARVQRGLRGDLDTIVLMALRKEPERRYVSVERFAADIRRHLAGLPVTARADTFRYRTGKFVRRNAVAVGAAATIALLLVAGSGAVAWQARIANLNAQRATGRFNELRSLARSVLFDYHDAVRDLPGSTPVRERMVKDGLEYLDKLSKEADDDRTLRRELAQGYLRMGEVQGGTMLSSLGNTSGSIASLKKAVAILDPLVREDSTDVTSIEDLAGVTRMLGMTLWEMGDPQAGLEHMRASVRLLAILATRPPVAADTRFRLHASQDYLGQIQAGLGDRSGAKVSYEASLAALDSMPATDRSTVRVRRGYSVAYEHLGMLLFDMAQFPAALENVHRAVELRRQLARDEPLNTDFRFITGIALYNEGEILAASGRTADAEARYRENLALHAALERSDPASEQYRGGLAYAEVRVGDMLARQGRHAEALAFFRQASARRIGDVTSDSANLWKRAALIEADARIAQTVARTGSPPQAAQLLGRVTAFMDGTTVDTSDAVIRTFFAETDGGLAGAWAALASRASGLKADACRHSARLFAKSTGTWADMARRGIASPLDSTKLRAMHLASEESLRACPRA